MSTYSASKMVAFPQSVEEGRGVRRPSAVAPCVISGRPNRRLCKRGVGRLRTLLSSVGGSRRLVANARTCYRVICHRGRHFCGDVGRKFARPFRNGPASARAMAAGARIVFDPLGGCYRKIRVAATAVLSATTGDHRSIYRRSAKTAGQCFRVRETSARRLCDRCGSRLSDRRVDRMVARRRLLGTSGVAIHRAVTRRRHGFRLRSLPFPRVGARARS